jgi:hypothetical protein
MAILAFRTSQVNLYLKEKKNPSRTADKIQEAINQKHGILLQRFHLLLWKPPLSMDKKQFSSSAGVPKGCF